MVIKQMLLTPNLYSRPTRRIHTVLGIVMHWTGVREQNAVTVRQFFEAHKAGTCGFASAHYVIGWKHGEIIQCIPDFEIAYHVGSSRPDPASGKIYTDEARRRFGKYAEFPESTSPNFCTLGIELCSKDDAGVFTEAVMKSAVALCAYLCIRHGLTAEDITTHHDVVGWKDCPRLWTERPTELEKFRVSVRDKMVKQFLLG